MNDENKLNAAAGCVERLVMLSDSIRAAGGDPTGNLMHDELVERFRRMSAVIAAARCIRHWHDREPDGMVVSKSHVFALWDALGELDSPNAERRHTEGDTNL